MTDKLREAAQMALDALDSDNPDIQLRAATHLRAALAQPEQEPVAWADKHDVEREGHDFWVSRQQPAKNGAPLYTAPPQRDVASAKAAEWQGLTAKDLAEIPASCFEGAIWADAKLREKNFTGEKQ